MRARASGLGLLVTAATAAAFVVAAPPSQAGTTGLTLSAGSYTIDTSALTFTGPSVSLTGRDVGGTAVFRFSALTIPAAATITVSGSRPVELVAAGTMTVAGTVIADGGDATTSDATPGAAGPGAGAGGAGQSPSGTWGVGGGSGGGGTASGKSSGGGGGAFGGNGAAGGKTNSDDHAGVGGSAYGNLNSSIQGGSGGAGASSVAGGGGGGAVVLRAKSLAIAGTGLVRTDGGSGAGGANGASGGGSGGGILLHADALSIHGTLQANGGAGGGGGCCGDGGGGGGGRIALQYRTYDAAPVALSVAGGASGAVGSGVKSPQTNGSDGVVTYRTIATTSLSVGRSRTVHRGRGVSVTTRLSNAVTGKVVARQHVVLYQRSSPKRHWTKVAVRSTSRRGTAIVHLTARRSMQYRWRYAGDWWHAAATSPVQTVHVRR